MLGGVLRQDPGTGSERLFPLICPNIGNFRVISFWMALSWKPRIDRACGGSRHVGHMLSSSLARKMRLVAMNRFPRPMAYFLFEAKPTPSYFHSLGVPEGGTRAKPGPPSGSMPEDKSWFTCRNDILPATLWPQVVNLIRISPTRAIRGRVVPCDLDWQHSNLTPAFGPETMKLPVDLLWNLVLSCFPS